MLFAGFISIGAFAAEATAKPNMKVMGSARAPIGHTVFCSQNPEDCQGKGNRTARIVLDSVNFAQLVGINRDINQQIAPVTDAELYGVAEYWTYPVNQQGDCEDYVLLKRKALIEAGWDPSALLITVVRDEKGDGHAVLTVVTDRGDLVLDNQREAVLPWQQTGYEYVKRQSQADPKAWVYVGPARPDAGVASAR